MKNNKMDIGKALSGLLDKYNIEHLHPFRLSEEGDAGYLTLLPGYFFDDPVPGKNQIPLLTWRVKRKYVELKKIVAEAVIENVCLHRFCCFGSKDNWSLFSLLYREMDLLEYIGNAKITSVKAVFSADQAGSVVLRLDNNALCSIEVGIQMPAGSPMIERHELIARRGVTSDLVVDTQLPQSSIYSFTKKGRNQYTDVDMELYGFDEMQIDHIRSAFQVLKNPQLVEQWKKQHRHLITLTNMAFESDSKRERIILK